jgi:tripartite-type tricarboxylate transporter receptor subunit TctC
MACAAAAQAQPDYPKRPVRFIVAQTPGGNADFVGRIIAEALGKRFGQQFVVDNRAGASGIIAAEITVKAPPDGYTLLLTPNNPLTILPSLRKMPYDAANGFEPIARIGDMVCGFVIHPAVGPKTFQEMVDYAKKNPGKLAFGSSGLGTATQLRLEMLKLKAGIDILHVPYRGGADSLTDVLANNVQMMNELSSLPHVKAGKLILLNVNHSQRHPDFPDVPTLTELGYPNSDVPIWFSVWAPARTPRDIVDKLNAKMVEIAKSEDMKARMHSINVVVPIQSPEEISKRLEEDTRSNAEVIKAANIKLE